MPGPSNDEQLMLEYVNDARLNPFQDAGRYLNSVSPLTSSDTDIQGAIDFFGVVGTVYRDALVALSPMQPLAWNENLATAARTHNDKMIAGDEQSHQVLSQGEDTLGNRTTAAGYTWSAIGENIYAYGHSVKEGHAAWMIDWGGNASTSGMQSPPGHRNNIMGVGNVSSLFREIGIGITPEANVSTAVGPLVMTEDFGNRSGLGPIILGVAYTDTNSNSFYTPGEGLANLTVSVAGGGNVTSYASGGYTLETTVGNKTITFSGAGLSGNVTVTTTLVANQNVKLDIINGNQLNTSTSVGVTGPVSNILGLGMVGLSITASDATARTIRGGEGGDTIVGGSSGDGLDGDVGNDLLTGGGGADSIDGGPGVDTANFSGNRSSYTITRTGSGETVSGPDGSDTLNRIEKLQFADMAVTLGQGPTREDVNTDNRADIIWWNDSTGLVACWYMDASGTVYTGGAPMGPTVPTTWKPIQAGDFNNDGHSDILWQNTADGTPCIWFENGTTFLAGPKLLNPGLAWTVKGLGDFNGDGKADILWQKSDGTPCVWLMNGSVILSGSSLPNPGAAWQVITAADFNGDGKSDILWQNTSGAAAIWFMDGTTVTGGGGIGNPGSTWHVRTAGDFDGDGQADIVWQNDSGAVSIWKMDGTLFLGGATVSPTIDPSWVVKGAGDFNGDGRADLLWQNTVDGTPAVWVMNNTTLVSSPHLTSPGTSWHVLTTTA